jgi:hypothetical protein
VTLHAGHCTTCDAPIWRTVTHGRTGVEDLTYPQPTSVYARVRHPAGGVIPGVGYCPAHAPAPGGDVVAVETVQRYAHWYTPAWGEGFRAWLADHCELPEHEVARVMAVWQDDCRAVEGVHA